MNGLNSGFGVVLGTQWGDEGKGKLVDILAANYDICARFNGGSNAGHSVKANGHKYAFHLLPCGVLYETCVNVIGNGVVVHLQSLFNELKQLDDTNVNYDGRLLISSRAHIVTNLHREADGFMEQKKGEDKIGTTKQGIGPTYATKALRNGLRIGDLVDWDQFVEKFNNFVATSIELFGVTDYDKEAELAELKIARDIVMEKKMIIDSVSYLH
jgi:adenylosuccinate synthase